ncbi:hypothetical protein KSC_000510 [Ktedonobacter sp. SOSP1-52]|uniref:hypothetical protein n=1 Tax=Ktedonobacter sp. SOSP1-52 TaxID=2778366 RepID=UPI0019162797|nr:hypothetical protein [Ktedonobacter sp. SOSP1-52]GHO61159.1 hypothetical protein KSC_000510 [Ktedonobacter sp. SOSP1-52]
MGNAQSSNHASLAPAVIKHILRLGGTFTPQTDPQEVVINGFVAPEPIRQLSYDVTWLKGVTYKNDDRSRVWVWSFEPCRFFSRKGVEEYPTDCATR